MQVYNRAMGNGSWASAEDYLPAGNALGYNTNWQFRYSGGEWVMMGTNGVPTEFYPTDSNGVNVQSVSELCACVVAPAQVAVCRALGYGGCVDETCAGVQLLALGLFTELYAESQLCLDPAPETFVLLAPWCGWYDCPQGRPGWRFGCPVCEWDNCRLTQCIFGPCPPSSGRIAPRFPWADCPAGSYIICGT